MEQLICYKELPVWTQQGIPQGFKNQHNTKVGTWAKLTVLRGELHFAILDESGAVLSHRPGIRLVLPVMICNVSYGFTVCHRITSAKNIS